MWWEGFLLQLIFVANFVSAFQRPHWPRIPLGIQSIYSLNCYNSDHAHCTNTLGLPDVMATQVLYLRSLLHDRQRYEYLLSTADKYSKQSKPFLLTKSLLK